MAGLYCTPVGVKQQEEEEEEELVYIIGLNLKYSK